MSSLDSLLDPHRQSASQRRATELARSDYRLLSSLVRLRKAAGLTQDDVAKIIGVTQPTVASFERHDADPKLSTIRRYAHAIGALVGHSVRPDSGELTIGMRWTTVTVPTRIEPRHAHNYSVAASKLADFSLAS